jgi:drug/metabolite transporter (DMT)-like permease
MEKNANLKGAAYMAAAMLGFTVNDSVVKSMTQGLNVGQIMFLRGAFTSLFVLGIAIWLDALKPLRTMFSPPLLFRAACEVVSALTYIYALGKIPISNASAILQALPLAVTLGAALFLHEPVGWRRWIAILVGFAGVMLIVRPGAEGFSLAALVCVISVFSAATRDLVTRKIDPAIPSLFVTLVSAVIVALAGALTIEPLGGWRPVSLPLLSHVVLASVGLLVGYQAIVLAMRKGEISFIAPFRYTSLLWSILFGIVFFAERPDLWTIVGSVIVIGSGLYSFYRENQRRRQAATTLLAQGS